MRRSKLFTPACPRDSKEVIQLDNSAIFELNEALSMLLACYIAAQNTVFLGKDF